LNGFEICTAFRVSDPQEYFPAVKPESKRPERSQHQHALIHAHTLDDQRTNAGQKCVCRQRVPWTQRSGAQKDICQLAGKSRATHCKNYKYDGSYEELGRLLREYRPAWRVKAEKLFTLIVLNYVCGNGYAHSKTFSLLETPSGDYSLRPAYDLLCTKLHLPTERRTAVDMFDDFITPGLNASAFAKRWDFMELANRFKLRQPRVAAILDRFAIKRSTMKALLNRSLHSPEGNAYYRAILADRL
jgi:serine/threonine-protein kinase HipA